MAQTIASPVGMTEEEIRALPVAVPLVTAGRALLMGRTKAHELARYNKFPCQVLRIGGSYVVRKVDLLKVLGLMAETS
ncbi:DNA-binding protein [Sphaerisporangium sp. TRM90804]|uniref:DNA-binding protein n=1 Tax=Sphaerisporangium sp. TRM90804 TaxID=3031113 RepID=UPI002449F3EB|nr:DNA-binding protein [Sphaerisporangium sp. TRM90804]MDH2429344.1 DNA-binding protein [Sphaerisporangium sp. TRM90804]